MKKALLVTFSVCLLAGIFFSTTALGADIDLAKKSHIQKILSRGELRVGFESGYVPFCMTDKKGNFIVKNLRGGVYRIAGGQSEQVFRLWAPKTAPPKTLAKASLVSTGKVVRAQFDGLGGLNLLGVGLGATGAILGGISLEKTNSISGR